MEVDRFLTMRRDHREIYRPPGGQIIENVNNGKSYGEGASHFYGRLASWLPSRSLKAVKRPFRSGHTISPPG